MRKTYGFVVKGTKNQKKMDWITNGQYASHCGMLKTNACAVVKQLLSFHMLKKDGRKIGVEEDYTCWRIPRSCKGRNSDAWCKTGRPVIGVEINDTTGLKNIVCRGTIPYKGRRKPKSTVLNRTYSNAN